MPLACAPESSAATAHSQTGRRRRPIAVPAPLPGPAPCPPPCVRPQRRAALAAGRPGSRPEGLVVPFDPPSSLARPPGASRWLRPAEWPALLAAGAAEGRREAGSLRISINLGPRRSRPPAPFAAASPPPQLRADSRRAACEQEVPKGAAPGGRGAGCCALGGPRAHQPLCRLRAQDRSKEADP